MNKQNSMNMDYPKSEYLTMLLVNYSFLMKYTLFWTAEIL